MLLALDQTPTDPDKLEEASAATPHLLWAQGDEARLDTPQMAIAVGEDQLINLGRVLRNTGVAWKPMGFAVKHANGFAFACKAQPTGLILISERGADKRASEFEVIESFF